MQKMLEIFLKISWLIQRFNFIFYRVDVSMPFQNCNVNRIKEMFESAFPNADSDQKKKLIEILDKYSENINERDSITPVALQRHFLRFKASSSDAIDNLHLLKDYLAQT